ncbi:hypothetical protein WN66_06560 [Saccharomyces cerevisiae]|nr:hypothetical protein WN66_06560 [Saccharomyces cerevisiae]
MELSQYLNYAFSLAYYIIIHLLCLSYIYEIIHKHKNVFVRPSKLEDALPLYKTGKNTNKEGNLRLISFIPLLLKSVKHSIRVYT